MKVLVVDDDRTIGRLLSKVLEAPGWTITVAGSLQEAKFHGKPDLLIADLWLPNGDGRQLQQTWPGVPMLVISGRPPDDLANAPFLAKPFTGVQLREALQLLLPKVSIPWASA